MEWFSDSESIKLNDREAFIIENDFREELQNVDHNHLLDYPLHDYSRSQGAVVKGRKPQIGDFEKFLLDNDFLEDAKTLDYRHLMQYPLFAPPIKRNRLSRSQEAVVKGRKSQIGDFEKFLLDNDFLEDAETLDYRHLMQYPLFAPSIKRNRLISQLICKRCTTPSSSTISHLQHMSKCRRIQHRCQRPKQSKFIFTCKICSYRTPRRVALENHDAIKHRCQSCNYRGRGLKQHLKTHQVGGKLKQPQAIPITPDNPFQEIRAFKGYVRTYRESGVQNQHSLINYLNKTRLFIRQLVMQSLQDLRLFKAQLSVYITYRRYLCRADNGKKIYETINKPMNSRMLAFVNNLGFNEVYDNWCATITHNVSIFQQYGSGWFLSRITGSDLRIGKLVPQRGGCWYRVPNKLVNKKAIINVTSKDNECFKWAVLAGLHRKDLSSTERKNPARSYYYKKYEDLYDFSCLEYPVELNRIPEFECKNRLAINVFSYDSDDGVLPVYISKNIYSGMMTIDLLLLCDHNTDDQHYATITDIHRLLGKVNHHRRLLCYNCLNSFPSCKSECSTPQCKKSCKLLGHIENCRQFKHQRIKMPAMIDGCPPYISFKNYINQLRADYVVYADFESLLIDEDTMPNEERESISYTEKQQAHMPSGFAYAVVDVDGKIVEGRVYRGTDAVEIFLKDLSEISTNVFSLYDCMAEMQITPMQQTEFESATHCHICELELGDDRVRDHDHRTGTYRGPAHNFCNLSYYQKKKLPVIMHNFRGYDSHLIVHGFHNFGDKVSVIPTNTERFMSVYVDGIVFIDSLQFLNSKLETLVDNLARDGNDDNFKLLRQLFPDQESLNLLKKKGVYPYDYFNSWSVFGEVTLPSEKCFYNQLRKEKLKAGNYAHAIEVFNHFECRHLGDYHDIYLMTDALLLGCVFESFRKVSLVTYKLDPVHYISAPGLAWDAALRMTGVELEQLTDIDIYEFLESGLRGGISVITKRKAEANNKYMSSYNGDESSDQQKYIISWDMNNLYGVAMIQKLPVSEFRFLTEEEIEDFNPMNVSDDAEDGFIIECDLEYDVKYHTTHNDYPLAPERTNVQFESLSSYQQSLVGKLEIKYHSDQVKLIPHLGSRQGYKVHYRNLKYYLTNGMTLTTIHRVLTFKQTDWLAPYIQFNTQMRTTAKNKFETDFFKLMNNSVYGKGMENVRKRMSVRLVNKWETAKRLIRKPQYMTHDVLHKNLCSFRMANGIVKLDKAVYTGFAVLDLSKLYMYRFHYDYVKNRYGANAQLLFTDTDSLAYEITTCDVYKDMQEDISLFDTSEYPTNHFLFSPRNKKVIGKMHDEANGEIIFKFIGLAPKIYCMVIGEFDKSREKKALRGVPKCIQDRSFKYDKYLDVLEQESRVYCKMKQIRSFKHKLSTVEICKSVLHGFDSKRYILDDGIHTLAWGHSLLDI